MAKGQKRSNREAKKPKKIAVERLRVSQTGPQPTARSPRLGDKDAARKR